MVPYIEPRVSINDMNNIDDFDRIAKRIGLDGYVILNYKYKKSEKEKDRKYQKIEHISRYEIYENQIENVRKELPKKRHYYELISVKTTSNKVAQWVVKDNRVDILSIPHESIKDIIIHPLANVAAENQTFIELDLNPLIFESRNNKSIFLRYLSRVLNILLQEKTPFILACNVNNPLMFRNKRAIFALAKSIGIPEFVIKRNTTDFFNRIKLNQRKLSGNMIAPGIWKSEFINESLEKDLDKKMKQNRVLELNQIEFENLVNKIQNTIGSERQRYILFEIIKENNEIIIEKDLMDSFWITYTNFFGIFNSANTGIYLIKYEEKISTGILRCSHKSLNSIRTALTLMNNINERNIIINVMKISGTMKNLLSIIDKKEK